MAKDKKSSKAAAAVAPKPAASKSEKVKAGRVTKPVESAKQTAKETAKKTAKAVEKKSKKKKDPTPEPSSSEEEEDETSASSESSDSEEEEEVKPVRANGKVNGAAKAAAKESDSESDSGSDSSDSESEAPAPKGAKAAKVNGAAKATAASDSDDSDSSSGSDSEEEAAPKANGKKAAASSDSEDDSDGSSDSSSDDEKDVKAGASAKADADDTSDGTSDSSDSDSDEEEEEKPKVAEKPSNKRKAEDAAVAATPKKTKMMVEGEEKDVTGNLFCGNLSWNVDEDWLTREFEEFGELSGVRIITDRDSGRSKGFGYVEFSDPSSAAAALEAKQGAQIDGREIRLDFSNGRQNQKAGQGQTPQQRSNDRAQRYGDTKSEPSATLFVGNISFDATQDMVYETFQDYGSINGIRLPTDRETGNPKGFGYVEMGSIDEAKAALEGLAGAEIAGRAIRLDYSTPKPPTDGGRGGFGGGRGGGRGGRGGRGGGFDGGRGRGRGGGRGGRGGTTNRGGFGDFSGQRKSFD